MLHGARAECFARAEIADIGEHGGVEDHKRCVLRRLGAEPREAVAEQIALDDARPVRGRDLDGRAQIGEALGLLRPDQRFEPRDLIAIREVNRIEVEPGAPDDLRQ